MNVRLSFAAYFTSILGVDHADIDVPGGTTVGGAIDGYLKDNPDYYRRLADKKLFMLGDFRAIYHINRKVVNKDHILNENDDLNILKAFIGG